MKRRNESLAAQLLRLALTVAATVILAEFIWKTPI